MATDHSVQQHPTPHSRGLQVNGETVSEESRSLSAPELTPILIGLNGRVRLGFISFASFPEKEACTPHIRTLRPSWSMENRKRDSHAEKRSMHPLRSSIGTDKEKRMLVICLSGKRTRGDCHTFLIRKITWRELVFSMSEICQPNWFDSFTSVASTLAWRGSAVYWAVAFAWRNSRHTVLPQRRGFTEAGWCAGCKSWWNAEMCRATDVFLLGQIYKKNDVEEKERGDKSRMSTTEKGRLSSNVLAPSEK